MLKLSSYGLVSFVLLFGSCGATPENLGNVTVEEIVENPGFYEGKRVTVSGEVEEVLGRRAFAIGGSGFVFDETLLVAGLTDLPAVQGRPEAAELRENDIVLATGNIGIFSRREFETRTGATVDEETFAERETKPVMMAESVTITPRALERDESTSIEREVPENPTPSEQ